MGGSPIHLILFPFSPPSINPSWYIFASTISSVRYRWLKATGERAMSSVKIFRPWDSVEEKKCSSDEKPVRDSAFTRVPEPHPVNEFTQFYDASYVIPNGFEEWSGFHALPFTPENMAQNLSYLDPAYLSVAFPEIYNTKMAKLKQRPKKFRCPHCKVSFSNNGQLKGHVRIHTGK